MEIQPLETITVRDVERIPSTICGGKNRPDSSRITRNLIKLYQNHEQVDQLQQSHTRMLKIHKNVKQLRFYMKTVSTSIKFN